MDRETEEWEQKTGKSPEKTRPLIFRKHLLPQELAPCPRDARRLPRLQRACPSAGLDELAGKRLPGIRGAVKEQIAISPPC